MGRVIKDIKQFSYQTDGAAYDELLSIAKEYRDAKNYVYSRYSGVKSLLIIQNSRKSIRDPWTENKFIESFGISKRFIRNAIEDAISNIKTNWKQCFKNVQKHVVDSEVFTAKQKHFIFYALKSNEMMFEILNRRKLSKLPPVFEEIKGDIPKLIKKICNLVRQHKSKISHTKKLTMLVDNEMYSYSKDKKEIFITGNTKGKRIGFKLTANQAFTGTIRICIQYNVVTIHKAIDAKTKPIHEEDAPEIKIGVDKNYTNMLDTSTDKSYGEEFGKMQTEITKELRDKNSKRNEYRTQIKNLTENAVKHPENAKQNSRKVANIVMFNLGNKKYDREKNRHDENKRKIMNSGIKKFYKEEKPTDVITEDLSAVIKSNKPRTKNVKHQLSSWNKGEIQKRIEYKALESEIEVRKINAAYTSQTCSCGHFGTRVGETFYCDDAKCVNSRGVYSGHEAARQILSRDSDPEITLTTGYKKVKDILKKRLIDSNETRSQSEPNQPRPPAKSRKERSVTPAQV